MKLSSTRRRSAIAGAFAAVGATCAFAALGPAPPGAVDEAKAGGRDRPNVVVVMTDDQDAASLEVMEGVDRTLAQNGTTFENFFASFPLCCPSRASFLTGQYAHNHGVIGNQPPDGGFKAFDDEETLPVWLGRAGYRTGYVGKYLNGYDSTRRRYIPPGWDDWHSPVQNTTSHMFDYTLNENGRFVDYGDAPSDYQTDVYGKKAARFVGDSAGRRPFFLTMAPLAPHGEIGRRGALPNPRPAPRHEARFEGTPLPKPPSFDEAEVADKPAFVRRAPRITEDEEARLRERYQDRLASLLAVDEAVERVVGALRESGELDDTLVVFTSDNGYLLGEHRLSEKNWLYEESARVPMIMRGPGVRAGTVRSQLTANVDLAPTILELTGARSRDTQVDGRSLLPLANDPDAGTARDLLFETARSTAIRTPKYMYARHRLDDGLEQELYDLREDPYQLESRHPGGPHSTPRYDAIKDDLARQLAELENCRGADCR
jgi:arylsulfatase A-like enzyme